MGFPHRGLGLKPSKEKGRGGGGGFRMEESYSMIGVSVDH